MSDQTVALEAFFRADLEIVEPWFGDLQLDLVSLQRVQVLAERR